jgi:hypothetical protein
LTFHLVRGARYGEGVAPHKRDAIEIASFQTLERLQEEFPMN